MSELEISLVRVTALVNRSDVARISEPHAEMSTAGVIIAERTEIASGKLVMCSARTVVEKLAESWLPRKLLYQ
jgi:hypothetical protein